MEIFISVKNDDYDDNFSFEALTTCFIPSPNLQHLTIPSCPFPSPINAAPRISTITSMSVFNTFPSMMVENFLPSLEVAKHLERFYFYSKDTYSWDETARLDYSPIAHVESLRSIDVTAPGMGTDFMRNLEAPVLSHARLDGWRRHYNPKYDKLTFKGQMKAEPISAALQRTSIRSPLLRSLQLEFIRLYKPDEEFPNILTGNWFPNLEELLLKEVSVKDQHFIEAARSSTPLKQLAVFKCKHVSARGLRPFVVGRQHGFSLTIELRPKVSSKAFKALSALCNITVRR
ncbi:hypothetical protein CPB83DRAFT_844643 [Crepidotus variabilis]|uniref:Uncharacterized protein n=1 Tax=Crepidotus variabilis TaxID=179855 RepID=A0A9P6EPY2_9AGAR|nr:hypothetical protein CPB83DRAFT_844643 [Crepidotus variabilis]